MQRREQYLLGGLLAAFVVWQGSGIVLSAVFGPFESRIAEFRGLQKSVSEKSDSLLQLARATKQMADWRSMSLPPDEPGKSKQPTGFDAGRMYTQWLTDLAQLCGFEGLKVAPGSANRKGNTFLPIVVKVEAEGRYDQLVRFLDLFYRTRLLHRITTIDVMTRVYEGDPLLTVKFDAEGLVLLDALRRRTLFPQTKIENPLLEGDTTIEVEETKDFPKQPGFRIQIKNEFLKVKEIDENFWTVERGVEQTAAAAHPEGATVELVSLDPKQSDRTIEELREIVMANIFVKPSPPQKLKLGSLAERSFVRGRTIDFTISATGYDTFRGSPEFTVIGDPPPGLRLDRKGRVQWKPDQSVAAGVYELKFEVRHPSIEHGSLSEKLAIRLRDPKAVPSLKPAPVPKAYLNRPFAYRPPLENSESEIAGYTWKLGENAPAGLSIDSKTGELTWTPSDEAPIGEITVPLIVTDNDIPPQETTLSLKLDVHDDAAQFTILTAIVTINGSKRLTLTDQTKANGKTDLREGESFAVADLVGTVKQIRLRHAIVTFGDRELRWEIGESLRDAQSHVKSFQ